MVTLQFSDAQACAITAADAVALADVLWKGDKTPVPGAVSLSVELKIAARGGSARTPVRIEPRELHHLSDALGQVAAAGGESDELRALREFLAPISDRG